MLPTLFEVCTPRPDVLSGKVESEYAADLAKVLRGSATREYQDPADFFAHTYPTRGLKNLLMRVCQRLTGHDQNIGVNSTSIFRLDTSYGGGKTHALIALAHMASGIRDVPGVEEFIDPTMLPAEIVRVAAFGRACHELRVALPSVGPHAQS